MNMKALKHFASWGIILGIVIVIASVIGASSKKKDPHEGQHCTLSNDVTGDCETWADDE